MTTSSNIKLGLIAFANDSGLGVQTKRLYQMLNPDKVMIVDSSYFSKNQKQHFDWYPKDSLITKGFPRNYDVLEFVEGLTHVLTVENPYNFYLIRVCQERGIATFCQTNYEFCDNINAPWLPVPTMFLMPSYWKLEEMKKRYGRHKVRYLPPPINNKEFADVRRFNLNRGKSKVRRFLHVVGTLAYKDRNGTLTLLKAVIETKKYFNLVIRSQHPLPEEYILKDKRIKYEIGNKKNNKDLYKDFDVLLLPRRYGGLSLTTNEALFSGMPVIMPMISPNIEMLKSDWLVPAKKVGKVETRNVVNRYEANIQALADKIDYFTEMPQERLNVEKNYACLLADNNFSEQVLKPEYEWLFKVFV